MKQGRTGLLWVKEHPLPFGVVLVAHFWGIEPFIVGEGNLLSMLLPTQPERMWDCGLLALLLIIFACYVQRGQLSERRRIEGPRCSMAGIVESSDTIAGKTLGGLIRGWDRTTQSHHGCAVRSLMPLELPVTHQPCSRQSGGEIS